MAGMAGEFLGGCDSKFFRDRIVAQIAGAKECFFTDPNSEDQMEQFIARNSPEQLEEFIFHHSMGNREKYLSLTADMLLAVRQCRRNPEPGPEGMNGAGNTLPNGDSATDQQTAQQPNGS